MSILKKWEAHCASLSAIGECIEIISGFLPVGGESKKLRKRLDEEWNKLRESTDKLDELITSQVQPIPVDFPLKDKEFVNHWTLYKEYLHEQHDIIIKSRMENARLKLIYDMCGGDRNMIVRSIDFYMAVGSPNVFPVNFQSITKEDPTNGTKKIIIPKF